MRREKWRMELEKKCLTEGGKCQLNSLSPTLLYYLCAYVCIVRLRLPPAMGFDPRHRAASFACPSCPNMTKTMGSNLHLHASSTAHCL